MGIRKQNWTKFLILFSYLISFACTSFAQSTVGSIDLYVRLPNQNPAVDVPVELYDSNGTMIDSSSSDETGYVNICGFNPDTEQCDGLLEGDYTLLPRPTHGTLEDGGLYTETSVAITISTADAGYNPPDDVQVLDDLILQTASRYLKVVLTEQAGPNSKGALAAGDPVPNAEVEAWPTGGDAGHTDFYKTAKTNSQGIAYLPIDDADTSRYTIHVWARNGYGEAWAEVTPQEGPGETEVAATVLKANATITVNLVDRITGNPFVVPEDYTFAVSCYSLDPDLEYYADKELQIGDSSAALDVYSGTYDCNVWGPGFGATGASTTVSAGENQAITLQLVAKDSQIKVRLVDASTNELISGLNAEILIVSSPNEEGQVGFDDSDFKQTSQGEETLSAVHGIIYEVLVFIDNGADADPENLGFVAAGDVLYLLPNEIIEVTANKDQEQLVEFPLTRANSSLSVTLTDPEGNPISGWLDAFSPCDESEDEPNEEVPAQANSFTTRAKAKSEADECIWSGALITNGQGTLPLLAGREYIVTAFPDYNQVQNYIPPASVTVMPLENDNLSLSFIAVSPNHHVNVSIALDTEGASITSENLVTPGVLDTIRMINKPLLTYLSATQRDSHWWPTRPAQLGKSDVTG